MLILVVGNINSGKTHAIPTIRKQLPEYPVFMIDAYRQEYGDGSMGGEEKARNRFVEDVSRAADGIVELSGMGPLGNLLSGRIAAKQFIMVYIATSEEVCIKRIVDKNFQQTPYPETQERMEDTIHRLNREFSEGALESLWADRPLAIVKVIGDEDTDVKIAEIPFRHFEKAAVVIKALNEMNDVREIVLYGSIVTPKFSKLSDIDMMISTEVSISEMEKRLETLPGLTFHDTPDAKITLYFDEILVEIVVVDSLEKNAKYFATSQVSDVSKTIVKGDALTAKKMEGILSAGRPDPATLISEAVKRLVFFVLSLDHIAKQGDRYKFFFHNNIIIHELVRLERLIQGDVSYHYLPKQVFESSALGLADLSFSFHDDMEEHIRKVRSMVHIFLKESNLLGKNIHLSSSDSKQKLDSSI